MANILDIAKSINKRYKMVGADGKENKDNKLVMLGTEIPAIQQIPASSSSFAWATYGGIPKGRVVEISGKFASGKSLLSTMLAADYLRENPDKYVLYVDVEGTFAKNFANKMTGIDLERVLWLNLDGSMPGEKIQDLILNEFLDDVDMGKSAEDLGFIIIDSVQAFVSTKDMESDVEKNNGMAGHMAAANARFVYKLSPKIKARDITCIMINTVSESSLPTGAIIYNEPGGKAIKHAKSVAIRMKKRSYIVGDKTDVNKSENSDGFVLHGSIEKSKCFFDDRKVFSIPFLKDTGHDRTRDLVETAINGGYFGKKSAQKFIIVNLLTGEPYKDDKGNDLILVYKSGCVKYFKEHPEFTEEYLKMFNEYLNQENINNGFTKEIEDELPEDEEVILDEIREE